MGAVPWPRLKEVAAGAWELDGDARTAFLDEACHGDHALRSEVEALLHASALAVGLYESPAFSMPGAMDAVVQAIGQRLEPGSRVGPFRLVRELGRGGMGRVFLAERIDADFTQTVAIKFISGLPDDLLLRRFAVERRIQASLDHPNITRLLDGGATPDGVPFVVMEYVAGESIDRFVESHALDVRARIALFRRVCDAVHYAHQRLVIHRDIKAANILVTADGTPKLLDFGIAKLVDPGAAPQTLGLAHTLASASPEQLLGRPLTIAVDVYGLGVLLYQLLTRESPYGDTIRSEAALVRAVCETIPRPPSAVALRAPGDRLDRDLDAIVLKALQKDPDRRYGSVEQFSDDLGRYVDGRPVLAAADSLPYRIRKHVRRHIGLTLAASAALVAILTGAGAAMYQAHVAQLQRARAQRRFEDVRRLATSFLFEFHDDIADLPGSLRARQAVVRRAAEYLDDLSREAQDDVVLQRELATSYERLATILGGGGVANLGEVAAAERRYLQALALREALAARSDATADDIRALAHVHMLLARFLVVKGDLGRAEHEASTAVAMFESPRAASSTPVTDLGEVATAYQALGYIQGRRDEGREALSSLLRAADYAARTFERGRSDADGARLARIQDDLGERLALSGRVADAIDTLQRAEREFVDLLTRDHLNVHYRESLAQAYVEEGRVHDGQGTWVAAEAAFANAATLADELLASNRDDLTIQLLSIHTNEARGDMWISANERGRGIDYLRRAQVQATELLKGSPENNYALNLLAAVDVEIGQALMRTRGDPEGCGFLRKGLALWTHMAASGTLPADSGANLGRFDALLVTCGKPR